MLGWRGIVPCKAGVMAQRLTDMVTTRLLSIRQVFGRLSPDRVAELMSPGVDSIAQTVVEETVPTPVRTAASAVGKAALRGLEPEAQEELAALRHQFVAGLTRDMQREIDGLVDLEGVVVGGFVREKRMLVDLFRRCGREELKFLVNSGFGFGVLLGVFQVTPTPPRPRSRG